MGRANQADCPALALFDHLLSGCPHYVQRTPHGDIDGAAKASHIGLKEQLAVAKGSVADGDIQPAKLTHGLSDQLLDG